MRVAKQGAVLLVALLFGVGIGYVLFRGAAPRPRPAPSPTTPVARHDRGRGADAKGGSQRSPGPDRSQTTAALLRAARARNAKLLAENKRLSLRLNLLGQDLRFARGQPMAWPPNTPGRLTRKPLVRALNQALQEAGLSGEVTDVDCREYPCVLSGNLTGRVTAERFKRILATPALSAYGKDHAQTSITNRSGHDSLGRPWQRSHFAIALMLAGPPGTELDVKRTVYRLRQLLDAATGQQ